MDNNFNLVKAGKDAEIKHLQFRSSREPMPNFGRPPLWDSPESMYNSFLDYYQYCKDSPVLVDEVYGKDATHCDMKRMQATTIVGFITFCRTNIQTWYDYTKRPNFVEVCSHIMVAMTSNNIVGAAANALNHQVISRIEGLVDKKEVSTNQIQTVMFHIPQIDGPKPLDLEEGDDWEII